MSSGSWRGSPRTPRHRPEDLAKEVDRLVHTSHQTFGIDAIAAGPDERLAKTLCAFTGGN